MSQAEGIRGEAPTCSWRVDVGGSHDVDALAKRVSVISASEDGAFERHIKNVTETDDSYIVEFGKSEEMPEVEAEVDVEIEAESGGHIEEERKAPAEMQTRRSANHGGLFLFNCI